VAQPAVELDAAQHPGTVVQAVDVVGLEVSVAVTYLPLRDTVLEQGRSRREILSGQLPQALFRTGIEEPPNEGLGLAEIGLPGSADGLGPGRGIDDRRSLGRRWRPWKGNGERLLTGDRFRLRNSLARFSLAPRSPAHVTIVRHRTGPSRDHRPKTVKRSRTLPSGGPGRRRTTKSKHRVEEVLKVAGWRPSSSSRPGSLILAEGGEVIGTATVALPDDQRRGLVELIGRYGRHHPSGALTITEGSIKASVRHTCRTPTHGHLREAVVTAVHCASRSLAG
jgi:hypothetical protein